MSILVVGSVAYDNLETPAGKRDDVLGGAATHFSVAASFFTDVHLVGIVGHDFEDAHIEFLRGRGINLNGLEVVTTGKTFRWTGSYLNDLNSAETHDTQLGVFAEFDPTLDEEQKTKPYLFLANIHPQLQLKVLDQMETPQLVAMDTMNLWINTERDALQKVIERVDCLFVNDGEAKLLTGESGMLAAAKTLRAWGPRIVVIKRGEYGSLLFTDAGIFSAPAFLLDSIADPTGAGDTFAGGFLGSVARAGNLEDETLRRGVLFGTVMASFQVQGFGLDRLRTLTRDEIEGRFSQLGKMLTADTSPLFAKA